MATTEKRYPFSAAKHAHDIEFYANKIWLTMREMEDGEIPMDVERYNRLNDMYYGPLNELRQAFAGACVRPVIYLTGKQIGLAKKIVVWASETRAATCIKNGRYDLIKYC